MSPHRVVPPLYRHRFVLIVLLRNWTFRAEQGLKQHLLDKARRNQLALKTIQALRFLERKSSRIESLGLSGSVQRYAEAKPPQSDRIEHQDFIRLKQRLIEELQRREALESKPVLQISSAPTLKNLKDKDPKLVVAASVKASPPKGPNEANGGIFSYLSGVLGKTSKSDPKKPEVAKAKDESWLRWKRTVGAGKADVNRQTSAFVRAVAEDGLSSTARVRRLELFCGHLLRFPWAKGHAVRDQAVGRLTLLREQPSSNEAVCLLCDEALALLGHQPPLPSRGIRILSLDGGGMRGVVALEVLSAFEQHTGKRIHELFDFICGVSTGSVIASFLAFHRSTVRSVEHHYLSVGLRVFSQSLLRGAHGIVTSHAYYDSQAFEALLRQSLGTMKMIEATRSGGGTPKVAIVSTLASVEPQEPFVFRSYHFPQGSQSSYQGSAKQPVWAAVRASSAAPGYFDEYVIDDTLHYDGGMMTNNATAIAIHEAQRLWPNERLHCVVSLGMGRQTRPIAADSLDLVKPKALSFAQKLSGLINAATETEITHNHCHDLLPGNVYFRFNPYLTEFYSLDEIRTEKIGQMREDTQLYIRRNYNRVVEACKQLTLGRGPIGVAGDVASHADLILRTRLSQLAEKV